jgi:post-segregation antitoxin (ccd killing protein)
MIGKLPNDSAALRTTEKALPGQPQDERNRHFQDEHRGAIEAHNRFIDKHGIWSQKYRLW